jgi:C4-dicarboxylate transporter DctQ subunit
MHLIKKVSVGIDAISKLTGIFSAVFMGLIAFVASYEVLMRYVFRNPTGWTIEFVPFLILWGTFLGGALTLKEDKHIRVDLLTRHLPAKFQKILQVITGGIGVIFCSALFVKGIEMVMHTKEMGTFTPGTLRIPVYIPQLCIPIGAALLFLQFLKRFSVDIASLKYDNKTHQGEPTP